MELPNMGVLKADALNSLVTVNPTSRYSPPSSTWLQPLALPFERLSESEPIKEFEQFEQLEPIDSPNRVKHPNVCGNVILAPGRW